MTYVQSTIFDITERKEAEARLRKLSRAVEQSPISVVITDLRGEIEYVNPKFSQLTGYSSEEVIGRNPRLLKSGLVPPATYKEIWGTILAGNVWRGELANRKKNGEIFWESSSIVPIRDSDGAITHFLGLKEDITGKKLAERALVEAEEKYRSLVLNIPDVAWTLDSSGQFVFISPTIEKLSGYSLAEIQEHGRGFSCNRSILTTSAECKRLWKLCLPGARRTTSSAACGARVGSGCGAHDRRQPMKKTGCDTPTGCCRTLRKGSGAKRPFANRSASCNRLLDALGAIPRRDPDENGMIVAVIECRLAGICPGE